MADQRKKHEEQLAKATDRVLDVAVEMAVLIERVHEGQIRGQLRAKFLDLTAAVREERRIRGCAHG